MEQVVDQVEFLLAEQGGEPDNFPVEYVQGVGPVERDQDFFLIGEEIVLYLVDEGVFVF